MVIHLIMMSTKATLCQDSAKYFAVVIPFRFLNQPLAQVIEEYIMGYLRVRDSHHFQSGPTSTLFFTSLLYYFLPN